MSARSFALCLALGIAPAMSAAAATSIDDAQLRVLVDQRLAGDRTGACLAVAVIEGDRVARSFRCADPGAEGRIDAASAFEIGSISKTMTATLLADLIGQGRAGLDDPLADYLPPGTKVPEFDGRPILLRHLVNHTSGLPALPARLTAAGVDPADPYARLDETQLLASLADVRLAAAPGSAFEYSNFASMLLSYAVARRAGSDLESLLRERLFAPLGMGGAYIARRPEGVRPAVGHMPNRESTPAWTFAVDLAGVGGVRATLEDMVRYLQGNLGQRPAAIAPALELAQQPVSAQPPMAMNWMLMPVSGRTVHTHEGGTGGFSSFVAFDRARGRGVVILSDTTWNSIGGLGSLGLHLVDAQFPLGGPRRAATPDPALLAALEGEYVLQGGMRMQLRPREGKLFVQAQGQGEYEMGYDDAGDFFPVALDAVLQPRDDGQGFAWRQMGGVVPATRIDAAASPASGPAPALDDAQLQAYAGEYPLAPAFVLTVRARDGRLHAQATGQGEFPLDAVAADLFAAPAFGIEIRFQRAAEREVAALELHQAGQVLRGSRR